MSTHLALRRQSLTRIALLLSTILAASAAHAQSATTSGSAAEQPPETGLADIIVTATRRPEKLRDVPIAVSAFTGEQIAALSTRDITSLTAQVPNVYITPIAAGPGGTSVFIRGIGISDIEKSFDPPIGVLLDGVYLGTNTGQLLQTFDVERIEVLRGPQGTLFGRNTTGGAISVTRTLPRGDEINGKVSTVLGSYGRHDFRGIVNIPLVKDHLWVKFTGASENDHGYFKNSVNPEATGGKKLLTGNATILWKPSPIFEIAVAYDRIRDDSQANPYGPHNISFSVPLPLVSETGFPAARNGANPLCVLYRFCQDNGPDPKRAFSNRVSTLRYDVNAVTSNATLHLNGFDIVSTTGYRRSTEQWLLDFDGSPFDILYLARDQKYSQFSQELRLATTGEGPLTFTGGLFYFESQYRLKQATFLDLAYFIGSPPVPGTNAPVPIPFMVGYETHHKSRSYAAYVNAGYKITDTVKLTVGGRGTYDRKNITFQVLNVTEIVAGNGTPSGPLIRPPAKGWSNFSPAATLDWKVAPDTLLYATYSRGYNSGGFNGRGSNLGDLGPYDPETVQNYELGVKAQTPDRRLSINANLFHLLYADKQQVVVVPNATFGDLTSVKNVASAEVNGFEIEAVAQPVRSVLLNAALGYLDARYTKFTAKIIPRFGVTDNTTLKPLRSPKFTVSAGAEYKMDAGPGELRFRTDYRWVDSFVVDLSNDPRSLVPPSSYIDLSARYKINDGRLKPSINVFVKNVTDTRVSHGFGEIGGVFALTNFEVGRQFGVELGMEF